MPLDPADVEYFHRGDTENPKFWSRLGGRPDLTGLTALDVGCGHGSLCVDMARSGARKVIGIDTDPARINFAKENVEANFPELAGTLDFRCCAITDLPERELDIIVSKDSFEHIVGLDRVVADMECRLKSGGRIYVGFGPLYNSPFGDHRRTGLPKLPWAHVVVPERQIVRRLRAQGRTDVNSIHDLGLNGLSLAQYQAIFRESGLRIARFGVNVSRSPISMLFCCLRRIPPLNEYFSHNIYCVLEKRS